MYSVEYTGAFRKDVKLCAKRGLDIQLLQDAINILARDGKLPPEYRPHILSGKYAGIWECHIKGDLLRSAFAQGCGMLRADVCNVLNYRILGGVFGDD